jgi:MFS family permease
MSLRYRERFPQWVKWSPLGIILTVTIAASINRQLVGLIAQPVKEAFALSDTQLGGIFSVAGIVGALISPFLGHLADVWDRHKIMVCAIALWSMATAFYGLAGTWVILGFSLALLMASEIILGPICNSLIAGEFHGKERINANLAYYAAGGLTTGLGAFAGGTLLHVSAQLVDRVRPYWSNVADWRLALLMTASVGLPLALLVSTLGPDRRQPEKEAMTDLRGLRSYLQDHWVTLAGFNIANAGYFIAATTVMGWIPIYIVRHFGITPADVGLRIGAIIGLADLLGIFAGMAVVKFLYSRFGPIAPRYMFQICLCLIAVCSGLQLVANDPQQMLILLGVQNFVATVGTASFNNMLQDISTPQVRGKVFGLNCLIVSFVGIPGPLLVGVISDSFGSDPRALIEAVSYVSISALLLS